MSGRRDSRSDRFLQALADSDPAESPDEWAARAALDLVCRARSQPSAA